MIIYFCNFAVDKRIMIDPTLYSLDVPPIAWGLLASMAICMLAAALLLWIRMARVRRRVRTDDETELPDDGYPALSVIIYSQADGHNLRTLLPQILNQDYPAPLEVIVANDESADNTETIVNELELQYPNLYMTFAPEQSRNLSRRKLAITLGIKAARYDALLLTCGNCRVDSPLWARRMMRHMIGGRKEVVIGYCEPWGNNEPDTDVRRRRRAFDTVRDAVRYLSSAIAGHPYMGTGYNLAYTRRLFFRHKGFSRTLNLNYGDDDIFINEIATRENTAVELSRQSRVRSIEYQPAAHHDTYRSRREFTARRLPRATYRAMGLASLLWWIWPFAGIGASLLGLPSLIPAAASLLLSLAFCIIQAALWRRTSLALGSRPLMWTVPWLLWGRPFRTMRHRIHERANRRTNLTHLI